MQQILEEIRLLKRTKRDVGSLSYNAMHQSINRLIRLYDEYEADELEEVNKMNASKENWRVRVKRFMGAE